MYHKGTDSEVANMIKKHFKAASKYDRLDILRYLYAKAEEQGIKHILHSGDFTDGRSNRPEQVYELKEPSYEGQID